MTFRLVIHVKFSENELVNSVHLMIVDINKHEFVQKRRHGDTHMYTNTHQLAQLPTHTDS